MQSGHWGTDPWMQWATQNLARCTQYSLRCMIFFYFHTAHGVVLFVSCKFFQCIPGSGPSLQAHLKFLFEDPSLVASIWCLMTYYIFRLHLLGIGFFRNILIKFLATFDLTKFIYIIWAIIHIYYVGIVLIIIIQFLFLKIISLK